jgi:antitoxin PrlF
MQITEKGQVTIPKHIRVAAGIAPGSEVSFSLEGSKIVMTPIGTGVKDDRRAKLRRAAARVRSSLSPEFRQLGATEIMAFIRGDEPAPANAARMVGSSRPRWPMPSRMLRWQRHGCPV